MSETETERRELPRYECHKSVWALKIAALEIHADKSATIAPADKGYEPFTTKPDWAARFDGGNGDWQDPGYYVEYGDGFTSWSPTKAFEEGYTKYGDLPQFSRGQVITENAMVIDLNGRAWWVNPSAMTIVRAEAK